MRVVEGPTVVTPFLCMQKAFTGKKQSSPWACLKIRFSPSIALSVYNLSSMRYII